MQATPTEQPSGAQAPSLDHPLLAWLILLSPLPAQLGALTPPLQARTLALPKLPRHCLHPPSLGLDSLAGRGLPNLLPLPLALPQLPQAGEGPLNRPQDPQYLPPQDMDSI